MVFSSPTFLFLFLPVTLLVYHLLPPASRWRNWWLLLASVLFYYWGAGSAIAVIFLVAVSSFGGSYIAWRVVRWQQARGDRAPARPLSALWLTALTLAVVLVPLLIFKYVPQVATLPLPYVRELLASVTATSWVLPLGVSFFTFHAVSYVIDSARDGQPLTRSFSSYLLYLFVFPHQIAGPIVRYSEIGPQIERERDITPCGFGYGASRFSWGLAKKVLIADNCGLVANAMFDNAHVDAQMSGPSAWIGALAYALQIYFDFSGYSDMAIGLAMMFGFRFPENFLAPYTSRNITEFWRRWHMTLTGWFRDYVYIPLGGNRRGRWVEYGALLLVFLLTSLWHGALIGFLIWGGMHSAALLFERFTGLRKARRLLVFSRAVTFLYVVIAWVPFRTTDVDRTFDIWKAMFTGPWDFTSPFVLVSLTPFTLAALVIGLAALLMPSGRRGFDVVFTSVGGAIESFRWRRAVVAVPTALLVTLVMVLWSDFSPFLYFQF